MATLFLRGLPARVAFAIVIALLSAASVDAAFVRGRLDTSKGGKRIGARGVKVTLYSHEFGRSIAVRTDSQGMYHLNMPAGEYWLEIWTSSKPRVYKVKVADPYTDVPPIKL